MRKENKKKEDKKDSDMDLFYHLINQRALSAEAAE